MKVVVVGATGNVGTSLVRALAADDAVAEIVGVARRRPALELPKTRWETANVELGDLAALVRDADCVVHLAWRIQPSHDVDALRRTNVDGSACLFRAVADAGVPALVYASSVGAYSPGPKDRRVDEAWPTGGTPTSFYARQKAEVERLLDGFEREHPDVRVVRLRPALIFKRASASEQRRYFLGPLFPGALARREAIPVVPDLPGLRFQALHADDVAEAYRLAVVGDARGAFNVAAEPVLDPPELARLLGARTLRLPVGAVRTAMAASWRLGLQPTPPGWLDMALSVPLMETRRARDELGWQPARSSGEAILELLAGLRDAQGEPTPPLEPTRGALERRKERRMATTDVRQQLVKHVDEAYAMEQNALRMLDGMLATTGEPDLREALSRHREETEQQAERLRARLEAHGASPSVVREAGGVAAALVKGVVDLARPEKAGRNARDGYATEHMEIASYELLERIALRAGDEETARVARRNREEEEAMAAAIATRWDAVAEQSLKESGVTA